MKRVAVPPLGHYGPVFARGLEALGYECVNIPAATRVALEHGCAAAPEDMCLPFKLVLGVFMDGMDAGAEAIQIAAAREAQRYEDRNKVADWFFDEWYGVMPSFADLPDDYIEVLLDLKNQIEKNSKLNLK